MSALLLNDDQRVLRATIADFLHEVIPLSSVRMRLEELDGYDHTVYDRLAREIGLSGLLVPDKLGGSGVGIIEVTAAAEALGAGLLPGPFLATTWATLLLRELDEEPAVTDLLAAIASGGVLAAVVDAEDRPVATRRAGGFRLDGSVCPVLSGTEVDHLLVVADMDGTAAVFAVPVDAPGLTRTPIEVLDLTRRQARIDLESTPAQLLGSPGADAACRRARDRAAVVLGGEQLGVMRAALAAIVEYSRLRIAFGRPIGSYQGVKHQLADLHASIELVESVVRHAAWTAEHRSEELSLAAALVTAVAGREAFTVTSECLRLFGGIGYTWQHDAHLYFKRAKSAQLLFGAPRLARARLAHLIGLNTGEAPS